MPKRELYSHLELELAQGELLIVVDPFARAIPDSELTLVQRSKRDEDWTTVEKYILPNMNELLKKQGREAKIVEIASESGLGKTKVKKLLSRYWLQGMNKNAMLPDYANSGGRGKTKKLSDEKVGRPRRVTVNGEYRSGINITDEIKTQFEHAINKYYRKANNYSLRDVYGFILRDFYSDRYKENGEIQYRIWESNRIPSYHQFYYWFKKLEDPKKDIDFRKSTKESELKHPKQKAPGAIQKEYRERGDRDYSATLNLKEFTALIITIILQHNRKIVEKYPMEKEMITDGIVPTPINLWNWGIQNRKGRLRTVDRDILRLNVLPRGRATISQAGIKFKIYCTVLKSD